MRFMFLGNFEQKHSTEGYISDALCAAGHFVSKIQEDRSTPGQLIALISDLEPDVLISSKFQLQGLPFSFTRSEPISLVAVLRTVRRTFPKLKIAAWVFDLMRPEFRQDRYDWSRGVSSECHRFFCTDSVLAADTSIYNGRLLRQGYPGPVKEIKLETMRHARCEGDVTFLGDAYGPRKLWIRALQREFGSRFKWYRAGIHGNELFHVCQSAKIVVGPSYPHFHGYWSNRIYLTAGYGGLFVGPATDGMLGEGWVPGRNYWGTELDVELQIEQIRYLLKNPETADKVRAEGTRFCRMHHSFHNRIPELIRELESIDV